MPEIAVGTVCYKTSGRNAGKIVVITGFEKETGMAVISGEGVKTKKCSFKHLWPTKEVVEVKEFMEKHGRKEKESLSGGAAREKKKTGVKKKKAK